MSHPLLLSHLPRTTSTPSSSFTLLSTTTPEHALQSGQHDLLKEHPVHHQPLRDLPVDKQRHQEPLWRENLQCGGNPRKTFSTLPKVNKEQVKDSLEPTQQELILRAPQEAGFSKPVGLDQFFRTGPRHNGVLASKKFTEPESIEGTMMMKVVLGQLQTWSLIRPIRLRGPRSHVH